MGKGMHDTCTSIFTPPFSPRKQKNLSPNISDPNEPEMSLRRASQHHSSIVTHIRGSSARNPRNLDLPIPEQQSAKRWIVRSHERATHQTRRKDDMERVRHSIILSCTFELRRSIHSIRQHRSESGHAELDKGHAGDLTRTLRGTILAEPVTSIFSQETIFPHHALEVKKLVEIIIIIIMKQIIRMRDNHSRQTPQKWCERKTS